MIGRRDGPDPAQRAPGPRQAPAVNGGAGAEARMALILVGLIVLPSALLGFLSWRAIENERRYSEERLRESYARLARITGSEINRQLQEFQARWAVELSGMAAHEAVPREAESLVSNRFVLPFPGRASVPAGALGAEPAQAAGSHPITPGELELFDRLTTRGEELEYLARDLPGAIRIYRQAGAGASNPRLKAMALSYVGRVQLKNADWTSALATFRTLFARYPEARDLNRMYLRFLAQYQSAVALEGLDRDREAVETLLQLNQDLLRRSDAINAVQYAYYHDLIQGLAARLLSSPALPDRATFERQFQQLGDQTKKQVGQRYLAQLLDGELTELVMRHKRQVSRMRFLSDRGQGDPFLVVFRTLPDASGAFVRGLVAVQIDLGRLRRALLPALAKGLEPEGAATMSIVGPGGEFVFGPTRPDGKPIAAAALADPFDFWQVGVYVTDVPGAMRRLDLRTTRWLWFVCLLFATILFASWIFIRQARRQAYLVRAQTSFVSNVTHELRTPLTSIKMFAELLEMQQSDGSRAADPEARATAAQYLEVIRSECDRLGRLIDWVLDFSRMERRARVYRFEARDLGRELRRVVESFRPYAESKGFLLELSVDENLPPVRLDADAFTQVILNLLENAVHYSDAVREIRVTAYRSASGRAAIEIADRGAGIPPNELPRLFERFYSGAQRSGAHAGLGLGLTLSLGIVRAHGGEIRVESQVGRGSTFTVLLPRAPSAEAAEAAAPPELPVEQVSARPAAGGSR